MVLQRESNTRQWSSRSWFAHDEVFAGCRSRSGRCNSIGFLTIHPRQHLLFRCHSRTNKSWLGTGGGICRICYSPLSLVCHTELTSTSLIAQHNNIVSAGACRYSQRHLVFQQREKRLMQLQSHTRRSTKTARWTKYQPTQARSPTAM